ncbi:MAG: cysteine hydrolase family protein [Candidatus Acidiferrales bacterium]
MVSRKFIFWDVDTQADFVLPGGKLYVPGAEKLLPNMELLAGAAREGRVFLVSSGDAHTPEDPELREWPPHCMRGTPGAAIVPQTLTQHYFVVPNRPAAALPADLGRYQQAILEKQTLNVFDNPNMDAVLARLNELTDADAEFVVFGVVTEYCVKFAAKGLLERGRRVAIVTDAIEALKPEDGRRTLAELTALGARLITTRDALALLDKTPQ